MTSLLWIQAKMSSTYKQPLETLSQHVAIMLYPCLAKIFFIVSKMSAFAHRHFDFKTQARWAQHDPQPPIWQQASSTNLYWDKCGIIQNHTESRIERIQLNIDLRNRQLHTRRLAQQVSCKVGQLRHHDVAHGFETFTFIIGQIWLKPVQHLWLGLRLPLFTWILVKLVPCHQVLQVLTQWHWLPTN